MKYDLSYFHILVEDWQSTKELLAQERNWRRKNNATRKDINSLAREFEYNGTTQDYFQKRDAITNPVGIARSTRAALQANYPEYKDNPKALDLARKEKGITHMSQIPVFKNNPLAMNGTPGLTDWHTNTTGYNINSPEYQKNKEAIQNHERHHAQQRFNLYNNGGIKAVNELDRRYRVDAKKGLTIFGPTSRYFANPVEYHANRAGIGKPPTQLQSINMLKAYINQGKPEKVKGKVTTQQNDLNSNKYTDRFVNTHKDQARDAFLQTLGTK